MSDELYLKRALGLARKGLGTTWPNPLVGCVIVKNGNIISEGFHQRKGEAHAELIAIERATESLEGATLYVNLEPCCHTNKTTPPCAQRIIQEKIRRVVVSNLDPNPHVNGAGIEMLRNHDIEVEHGLLCDEGEKLNEVFFTAHRKKRPFIHFKAATTLDAKIAMPRGESKWITGEKARAQVHVLRAQNQAIITSGETIRRDNPHLTVRTPGFNGMQPYRVIISQKGNFDSSLNVFLNNEARTFVYTSIEEAMEDLLDKNIISCLLECGANLATEFMKKKLIDRITLFQNLSFLGEGKPLFHDLGYGHLQERSELIDRESRWFDDDHMITGRIQCSQV
jgi:diaminohydroxyphosphoribosylaminopyrimidine deaminase/5-amino-6-(5-phosphoribosylamino)uracil reductase